MLLLLEAAKDALRLLRHQKLHLCVRQSLTGRKQFDVGNFEDN